MNLSHKSDPSGAGCFINGIMEGFAYDLDATGNVIVEDIATIARKEYDRKQLTEARKVQLFQLLMNKVSQL